MSEAAELAELRDALLEGRRRSHNRHNSEVMTRLHTDEPERWRKRMPNDTGLSVKWHTIIAMQMRGWKTGQIAEKLGMSQQTVSNITKTEKYRQHFAARIGDLDHELITLKPKAIAALENALVSANEETGLRAAKEFFQVTGTGSYGKSSGPVASASAEDLARALLVAAKQEVHVHIGTAPSPSLDQEIQVGLALGSGPAGRQDDGIGRGVPAARSGDQRPDQRDEASHPGQPYRLERDGGGNGQGEHRPATVGTGPVDHNSSVDFGLSRRSNLRESLS